MGIKRVLFIVVATIAGSAISWSQDSVVEDSFEEQWKTVAKNQKLGVISRLDRLVRPGATKIGIYFGFDGEKQAELENVLKASLDEASDAYVEACRKVIEALDEKKKKVAMTRGMVSNYLPGSPDYRKFNPALRQVYKEGMVALLTPDELAEWENRKRRLENAKFDVLARHLIVLFGREAALTASQRETLRALISKRLEKESSSRTFQEWSTTSERSFFSFLKNKNHVNEISTHLNDVQKQQFADWSKLVIGYSQKLEAKLPKRSQDEPLETYRERLIASVVQTHKIRDMQPRLRILIGRVDHLDAAVQLNPQQRASLELAIKGMVELMYDDHMIAVETNTRRWVESVKDGDYNRYTKNLRVQRCFQNPNEKFWDDTLDRVLTVSQKQTWGKITAGNKQFTHETAMSTMRLKTEQLLNLREDQWKTLAPLIEKEMSGEIKEIPQNHYTKAPWFFNPYQLFYPALKAPDRAIRKVFTDRQWQIWMDIKGRVDRYFDNIELGKQRREAMVKNQKSTNPQTESSLQIPDTEKETALHWRNGGMLSGQMLSASPSTVTWKSPSFSEPVVVDRDHLQGVFSPRLPDGNESQYLIEMHEGSRLFGRVQNSDDESHLLLESLNFDPIHLNRSAIKRVRLMRSDSLRWAGPYGKLGWRNEDGEKLVGLPQWTDEGNGGKLRFLQMARTAELDLDLPNRFEMQISLESEDFPQFVLTVISGSRKVKLETWDRSIVLRTGDTEFSLVRTLKESEKSVTLRLFWDGEAGSGFVCSQAGEVLTRFKAVELIPGEIQSQIKMRSRSPNLEISSMEIWDWDGLEPPGNRERGEMALENPVPSKPSTMPLVELMDTGRIYGKMVKAGPDFASFEVDFSKDLFRVKNSLIRQLHLTRENQQDETKQDGAQLQVGGATIAGNWIPSNSNLLLWKLEGAKLPAPIRTDHKMDLKILLPPTTDGVPEKTSMAYFNSGEIIPGKFRAFDSQANSVNFEGTMFEKKVLDQDLLQAIIFDTRCINSDLESSDWTKIGKGKVDIKGRTITLHEKGTLGHPSFLWGGKVTFDLPNSTTSTPSLKMQLFCDGIDPTSKSTRLFFRHYRNNLTITGLKQSGRAYISKNFRTVGKSEQKVELTWDDTALKIKVGKNEMKVVFDAISGRSGFGIIFEQFGGGKNKSIVFSNIAPSEGIAVTPIPYISPDAIKPVLFVPRFLKGKEPKHALLGNNGDVLRGELQVFDGGLFHMKSGKLSSKIARDNVAGIVRLPVPPLSEPSSPGVWFLLRNGARFFLEEPVFGTEFVTGKSASLGRCQIPLGQIGSLHCGAPPKNPPTQYLASFQLTNAPEPGEAGVENSLTGRPAPDFTLPQLGGGEVELFEYRGKVVVVCFWVTWNAPSLRRVNELRNLVNGFSEDDVQFIAINAGEPMSAIQQTVTKQGWSEVAVAIDRDLKLAGVLKLTLIPRP